MSDTYDEVQAEILAAVPEQCEPCHRPELSAGRLAESVIAGEVELEAAKTWLFDDISKNCRYGAVDPEGCFGGVQCAYGVLCQYPGPIPLNRLIT